MLELLRDEIYVLSKALKDIPREVRYYRKYKELQQKLNVSKEKLKRYIREG